MGAIALAIAALRLGDADRSVGQGVVAERAATYGGAVEARWRALAQDPEPWFEVDGPSTRAWRESELVEPVPPARAIVGVEADAALIASLLRRAEDASTAAQAAQSLEAAREMVADPTLLAEVELRTIRAAVREGDTDAVRAAFERMWSATPGDVATQGQPTRVIGLLAASDDLEPGRVRSAAEESFVDLREGRLTLPMPLTTRADANVGSAISVDARVRALLERLGELVGGEQGARLVDEAQRGLLERAYFEQVEDLLPAPGELAFIPAGPSWRIVERRADGGRYVDRTEAELVAILAGAIRDDGLLDPELQLARVGDGANRERLGPPLRLAGTDIVVELSHPDLEAWTGSASNRVRTVRVGLWLLAALALAGGIGVAAASRRERRLAELRTRWIASVSHELRTPVAALLLTAERLDRTLAERPARLPGYHAAILKETRRLGRLVSQVMDLARIERGRPPAIERREVDPRAMLDEQLEGLEALVTSGGLELCREAQELPARVELDPEAIGRVLENLLRNAAEHSGGARVLVSWRVDADRLVIEVRDDGRGIERRESLFRPFQRGRAADTSKGLGLGLGIARELVRAHHGELVLLGPRTPWSGAGFRVELPLDARDRGSE